MNNITLRVEAGSDVVVETKCPMTAFIGYTLAKTDFPHRSIFIRANDGKGLLGWSTIAYRYPKFKRQHATGRYREGWKMTIEEFYKKFS